MQSPALTAITVHWEFRSLDWIANSRKQNPQQVITSDYNTYCWSHARHVTGGHDIHAQVHGLIHPSFMLRADQALISPIESLPRGCDML
jgi:hypothetical protein